MQCGSLPAWVAQAGVRLCPTLEADKSDCVCLFIPSDVCLHLQSRLLSQLKKGTSTIKAALPRIKDVNVIDKYSRVIFPVSFLVFNIAYWCFYVFEY